MPAPAADVFVLVRFGGLDTVLGRHTQDMPHSRADTGITGTVAP